MSSVGATTEPESLAHPWLNLIACKRRPTVASNISALVHELARAIGGKLRHNQLFLKWRSLMPLSRTGVKLIFLAFSQRYEQVLSWWTPA